MNAEPSKTPTLTSGRWTRPAVLAAVGAFVVNVCGSIVASEGRPVAGALVCAGWLSVSILVARRLPFGTPRALVRLATVFSSALCVGDCVVPVKATFGDHVLWCVTGAGGGAIALLAHTRLVPASAPA